MQENKPSESVCLDTQTVFSTTTSKQIPKGLKFILTAPKRLTDTVQEGAWEMFYQILETKPP